MVSYLGFFMLGVAVGIIVTAKTTGDWKEAAETWEEAAMAWKRNYYATEEGRRFKPGVKT